MAEVRLKEEPEDYEPEEEDKSRSSELGDIPLHKGVHVQKTPANFYSALKKNRRYDNHTRTSPRLYLCLCKE
ncbi:hypothetical protein WMY93_005197 [Mugilogobius chulae]|uniref:Uncharacterized protein n=1 Tax=Mugilogobius chulae TaxID=88201 RepID=A0AAW0Q1E4_9GOBI